MEAALSPSLHALKASATTVSDTLSNPTSILERIVSLASAIIASSTRTRSALTPLGAAMDDLTEEAETTSHVHILHHHIAALAAAASAFAWVADPAPLAAIRCAQMAARNPISALQNKDVAHSEFANAVDNFLNVLEDFVRNNHQAPLVFADADVDDVVAQPSASPSVAVANDYDESHSAAHLVAFRENIAQGVLKGFVQASAALGGLVKEQADAVDDAFLKTYLFLVDASGKKKPVSTDELQKDLAPIALQMSVVAKFPGKCAPRDVFVNHLTAVAEAINMLSWVSAESTPTSFVSEAEGAASFYLNKILTATKSEGNFADHRAFVLAVRKLLDETKAYIKTFHTMGVAYDKGVIAQTGSQDRSVPSAAGATSELEQDTYVSKFNDLVEASVAAYVAASEKIGGEVAQQAAVLMAAFKAEADFLGKAISMPKPDDIQDMLAPIAAEMGKVAAITEKMDPRGPLTNHCTAVSEAVSALGWVAVDEKAAVFVGDMAGAGQFFLDKVKMGSKNASDPKAHREWAKAVETLFKELKAYVKEHHTQHLVWNPPRRVNRSVTRAAVNVQEEASGDDYVSKFKELIDGSLAAFLAASSKIGGDVSKQANAFAAAWKAEADFLAKAISMPKPADIQDMLAPIAKEMGAVSAIVESMDPRGPLANHCTAVSESVSALGWVAVDEKATGFVGDMAGAGQFFLDKVKMAAKTTDDPTAHREWAKALETLFADLKAYVKENHTQALVWNPPKIVKARPAVARASNGNGTEESSSGDYVTKFEQFIDETVVAYANVSKNLGGPLVEQSDAFLAAFRAEAAFLKQAISMPKPADIQNLLAPIAAEMGKVSSVAEKVDPRGPFANHCTAISESVSALGWVAVEEKATGYVGDMAGAGQFFLDKVKMGAKNTDNPAIHREWAKSVESVFAGLKAYVKEHHTQKLVWNPPKRAMKQPGASVSESNASSGGDFLSQFKDLIAGPLSAYMTASSNLGGDVAEQSKALAAAWQAEAEFLAKAISMEKPVDIQSMLAPIAEQMGAVTAITEKMDPRGPLANHCTAVSESVAALGWVAVEEKAAVFVGDMAGAGQFFLDKVKMAARGTDNPEAHREWAKSLESLFKELRAYVKENHTQRLTWKQ